VTTSGTITSQLLVSDLVTDAMQELGVLAAGERPTGQELQDGIRALNWMLKSWQARGVVSWRDTDGSVIFPAGTATMVLSPFCLDVLEARLVQAPAYERPLQRWELAQYRQIPNKQTPGYPTAYSISKTDTAIMMTVWPVPNADMTVNYSYPRIVEDVTDGAQTIDIPQEWQEAAYLALAARLVQTFGINRIDPQVAQIVAQRASALEQLLLDQDRPASIYMGSAYGRVF
jgi:hypothetical protein